MNIPLIAYGTWVENFDNAPIMKNLVKTAIELGYTHIDTARNYGTEKYVIQAINESNIPRDNIFLTSKIQSLIDPSELRSELNQIQYYDLLLLHYPPLNSESKGNFKNKILPLWVGMQNYLDIGIAKSIGVSNFYQNHLDLLLEICDDLGLIKPVVNQIEIHPGNLELEYVPYMQNKGIISFAHTPLGGLGSKYLLINDIFIDIGKRIGATPAQVVLAYLLKRNIGIVTASKNPVHMNESIHVGSFIDELTPEDMELIDSTDVNMGPIVEGSRYSWEDNYNLY